MSFVYVGGTRGADGKTTRKLNQSDGSEVWAVDHGATVYRVAVDADGYVYSGGVRTNAVGGEYATTRKYNSAGDLLWSVDDGGSILVVAADADGNVYTGGYDGVLRKYNSASELQWSETHGDSITGIACDASGNVYIGGLKDGTADQMTTRKYDSAGNLLWSIAEDDYGLANLAVVGSYLYTAADTDFSDPAVASTRKRNTSDGSLAWEAIHGGSVYGIAADSSGNVYAGGAWTDAVGGEYATTRKYDSAGTLQWSVDHDHTIFGVALDGEGGVYTCGARGTEGTDRPVLRKYSSAGTLLWHIETGQTYLYGVAADPGTAFAGGGVVRGRRVPEFTVSFLRRDFTGGVIAPRCTFRPTLMSWTALGGCDLATVVATGNEGALWDLADMLRCPVQIIDQDGQFAWWGYVAAVNIDFGQLSFGVNLDSMANRVAVAYADQGSGITTSSRATTDWAEDGDSVTEYGSFERLESLSDAGDTEAEARRDALLEALKWPVPEIDFGNRGLAGTLTCRGWWHALKRRYYINETTTDVETTEQIEAIIGDVGSEFFTGCVIQDASGVYSNEYRDGDSNAWQIIEDLLQSGVAAASVRLLANVDVTRTLEVYQEPVPGASDGRLYPNGEMTDGHGASIRIGPGLVGRHARLADVIPPYVNLARVADPTRVFIERAEYDVERVRLRPQPRGSSVYQVSRVEAG